MKTLTQIVCKDCFYENELPYCPKFCPLTFKHVREWLLLNLIDITELVGAEIYDANLINDYITDKLLEAL